MGSRLHAWPPNIPAAISTSAVLGNIYNVLFVHDSEEIASYGICLRTCSHDGQLAMRRNYSWGLVAPEHNNTHVATIVAARHCSPVCYHIPVRMSSRACCIVHRIRGLLPAPQPSDAMYNTKCSRRHPHRDVVANGAAMSRGHNRCNMGVVVLGGHEAPTIVSPHRQLPVVRLVVTRKPLVYPCSKFLVALKELSEALPTTCCSLCPT